MTSVTENLARVRSELSAQSSGEIDHGRILDEHKEAIREHERQMAEQRRRSHKRRRRDDEYDMRFRFKGQDSSSSRPRRSARSRGPVDPEDDGSSIDRFTAHPLGRPEPETGLLDPTEVGDAPATVPNNDGQGVDADPDAAFKTSLFDALADDEGAAAYWEAVYNQPIHIYPRPDPTTSDNTTDDASQTQPVLEAMTDDEYAAYVKHKMWERSNPHLAREMKARDNTRDGHESRRHNTRRPRQGDRDNDARVRVEMEAALERGRKRKRAKLVAVADGNYRQAWSKLLSLDESNKAKQPAADLPWPVLHASSSMPDLDSAATIADIQTFLGECLLQEGETRLGRLKAERFRWHPDKMMHRLGGELGRDKGLLRAVTRVFQIIDELVKAETGHSAADNGQ